jgi:glycosyltransferase involved in cell wall biosynthesis
MITGSYPPMRCGVGAYTQRLVWALGEIPTVKVSVLTDKRACKFNAHEGIDIFPVINGWKVTELLRVMNYVKELAPDIVHIQYPTQGYASRFLPMFLPLAIRLLGRPCVQTWHEPVLGKMSFCLTLGLTVLVSVRKKIVKKISKLTRSRLRKTPFFWIPAASLLPTITLNSEERLKIRRQYTSDDEFLFVFYGFIAPLKGIETLLEVIKKTKARLLLVCDINSDDEYSTFLQDKILFMGLESRVIITGFLPDLQLASLLAASDAAVFPFKDGVGNWNTSVDGAVAQGVFVLTTSLVVNGYNEDKNIYFAKPNNVDEMIVALQKHAGHRGLAKPSRAKWKAIAEQHVGLYRKLIER